MLTTDLYCSVKCRYPFQYTQTIDTAFLKQKMMNTDIPLFGCFIIKTSLAMMKSLKTDTLKIFCWMSKMHKDIENMKVLYYFYWNFHSKLNKSDSSLTIALISSNTALIFVKLAINMLMAVYMIIHRYWIFNSF